MNKWNNIFWIVAITGLLFMSCEKDNKTPAGNINDTPIVLADEVVGNYSGLIVNSSTDQSQSAVLVVNAINDSVVTLSCIANGIDTTIMVQLYENSQQINVCFLGQDFYNQYGYNLNNNDFCTSKPEGWNNDWCMNNNCWGGQDQWNAWTNHQNSQHNQGDVHFGGFDLENISCNYGFQFSSPDSSWIETFTGTRD